MSTNTNPNRTVSQRDTKAVIYAEVERLRALLEEREAQITLQAESIERLQTRVSNAKVVYLDMRAEIEGRCRCIDCGGDRNEHDPWCSGMRETHGDDTLASDIAEIAQRSAILLKRSTRVRGARVEQYKDGEWIAVPKRVLKFAAAS